MASSRVTSGRPSTVISPSTISPVPYAFWSGVSSDSLAVEPTQSERYSVWPVTGRTWPITSQRPSAGGRVEQHVGEAEVGQHPPVGQQPQEVDDVGPLEVRVLPSEVREGGHGLPVCPPGAGLRGQRQQHWPRRTRLARSFTGSSRIGTVTRTSAVVASSARCSASRVAHDGVVGEALAHLGKHPPHAVARPVDEPGHGVGQVGGVARGRRTAISAGRSPQQVVGERLVDDHRAEAAACAAAARPRRSRPRGPARSPSVVTTQNVVRASPISCADAAGPARRSPSPSTGGARRTRRCPAGSGRRGSGRRW